MKAFRPLFWRRTSPLKRGSSAQPHSTQSFRGTYRALSSASVETLWQRLTNLADVSWHPLINSTNCPQGLTAKPGLIYRAMPRWLPIPISIFVESVSPQELLSIRISPVPGLEERIVYQLKSTLLGTQVSYSIMLRGWLSPFAWSILKPFAARMAAAIAKAAEE